MYVCMFLKIWEWCHFQYTLVCSSERVPRILTNGMLTEQEQNRTEGIENGYGTNMENAHFKLPLQNFGITYHLILEVHYFYHLLRKHLRRIFLEKHFLKYFNCLHDVYNFSWDITAIFLFFYVIHIILTSY